jgi:hypothetical protein
MNIMWFFDEPDCCSSNAVTPFHYSLITRRPKLRVQVSNSEICRRLAVNVSICSIKYPNLRAADRLYPSVVPHHETTPGLFSRHVYIRLLVVSAPA